MGRSTRASGSSFFRDFHERVLNRPEIVNSFLFYPNRRERKNYFCEVILCNHKPYSILGENIESGSFSGENFVHSEIPTLRNKALPLFSPFSIVKEVVIKRVEKVLPSIFALTKFRKGG